MMRFFNKLMIYKELLRIYIWDQGKWWKMESYGSEEIDRKIVEAFKVRKLKITPQRIAIVKALSRMDHPTAEEIYEEVRKEQPYISLATIYRTLKLLINAGLVKELCLPDGVIRYDTNIKTHINLVCVNCGKIIDIDVDEYIDKLTEKIKESIEGRGFKIVGYRFDIDVYCDNCMVRTDLGGDSTAGFDNEV
jgi:Fur family peroxide stress response transcriptional regulator